jgi:hypothetical protein
MPDTSTDPNAVRLRHRHERRAAVQPPMGQTAPNNNTSGKAKSDANGG